MYLHNYGFWICFAKGSARNWQALDDLTSGQFYKICASMDRPQTNLYRHGQIVSYVESYDGAVRAKEAFKRGRL